jgi:hypothetical protein
MPEDEASAPLNQSVLGHLREHHWWTLEQFLCIARSVEGEEFRRDLNLSYGSVHGILAHHDPSG